MVFRQRRQLTRPLPAIKTPFPVPTRGAGIHQPSTLRVDVSALSRALIHAIMLPRRQHHGVRLIRRPRQFTDYLRDLRVRARGVINLWWFTVSDSLRLAFARFVLLPVFVVVHAHVFPAFALALAPRQRRAQQRERLPAPRRRLHERARSSARRSNDRAHHLHLRLVRRQRKSHLARRDGAFPRALRRRTRIRGRASAVVGVCGRARVVRALEVRHRVDERDAMWRRGGFSGRPFQEGCRDSRTDGKKKDQGDDDARGGWSKRCDALETVLHARARCERTRGASPRDDVAGDDVASDAIGVVAREDIGDDDGHVALDRGAQRREG